MISGWGGKAGGRQIRNLLLADDVSECMVYMNTNGSLKYIGTL